jgi:Histidine kinase-, DNA gyrase B-, and HSP90-like ATPase
MTEERRRHAPPKAGAMLESLRGLGYSPSTALADLIDNSISAGSTLIDLIFEWKGHESSIRVIDNGTGMSPDQLDAAMRLGERSPLDDRAPGDLGRFGLGLKTSSFSQCRCLTVATTQGNVTSCLRWDLDVLAAAEGDGWFLLEGAAASAQDLVAPVYAMKQGTIVLWERLDRIITAGFQSQDFLNLIDRIEAHLAMVFHRFLRYPATMKLQINGREVKAWDPYLLDNPATWSSPVERLMAAGSAVEVQSHVLPHKDRLTSQEQETAAGPHGWTAQQGFYVYRNRRMLVAGSWLGLGRGRSWTKEEAHRLARIRLDILNTSDAEWAIDVRKSTARPPLEIRERLTLLAEDTRSRARKVFAHRGVPARSPEGGPVMQAWRAERYPGGLRYRIDLTYPVIRETLEESGELEDGIRAMLRVIEETVPVQRIWLDTSELRETPRTGFAGAPEGDVTAVLSVIYRNMVLRKGLSSADARSALKRMEPFSGYPDLVDALPALEENGFRGD